MPEPQTAAGRVLLLAVDHALAARIVAGDLTGLRPGAGWPHAATLDGLRLAQQRTGAAGVTGWLIALRDRTIVGDCGWKGAPDAAGVVEIGYGLAPPYHRQGYGGEAVALFADWSLRQPGVRRLVAETHLDNVASRRVLERAGFALARSERGWAYYERGEGRP